MADSKHQTTSEDINIIRIWNVCLELWPSILGTIIEKQLASTHAAQISNGLGKLFTETERTKITKFSKDRTYKRFDCSLLFKLIRNISTTNPQLLEIAPPKMGWGNRKIQFSTETTESENDDSSKQENDLTVGDALEEMIFFRNQYIHNTKEISNEHFKKVWRRFQDICSRLEHEYGEKWTDSLQEYLIRSVMDDETKRILKEAQKKKYHITASIVVWGGTYAFYQAYREKGKKNGRNSPPQYTSCDSPNTTEHMTERGKTTKVEWQNVVAMDAEDGPITPELIAGEPSGSMFRKGTYTIRYLATDSGGLEKTCRINFSVEESSIRCEKESMDHFLQNGNNEEMLTWDKSSLYSTTDAVPPRVEQIFGLPPGSPFPKGSYDIVYKITDSKGVSVNCSFTINVFDQAQHPLLKYMPQSQMCMKPDMTVLRTDNPSSSDSVNTGYGVKDPNYEKVIADITSKGQKIKEGVAIGEVEKQNMSEIAGKFIYLFPEMTQRFKKWTKENHSSTHASPFSKWVTQERYPQCKPEDGPKNKEAIEEEKKKSDNSTSPYPDIQHDTPRNRLQGGGGGGPGGGGPGAGGGQGGPGGGQGGGPREGPGGGPRGEPREGGPGEPREGGPGAHGGSGGNDGGRGSHGDGGRNDGSGGRHGGVGGGDEGAGGQGSGFGGCGEGGEGYRDCHRRNTDHGGCGGRNSTSNNYQNSEDGKFGINIIDGKTSSTLYPENRGWNEAPIPKRRISRKPQEPDNSHTRSDDNLQKRFPNITKTTAKEGNPCIICQFPVEDAYVYHAPLRDFLMHGDCIVILIGG